MTSIGPSLPPIGPVAPRVDDTLDQKDIRAFDFTFAGYIEGAYSVPLPAAAGEASIETLAANVLDRILAR